METRTALVAGASGLVGGLLLDSLLESPLYREVCSLGRRPVSKQHPRLTQRTVDFTRLEGEDLPAADDAFCCLGTTIKKAGSQEAFRAVDHDAVLAFAKASRKAGARRFLLVSALGADSRSRIFYNRVKGETEEALAGMGFDTLVIARPSFLVGDRKALGQPERGGEKLALRVSNWLAPLIPDNYRSVDAGAVARALLKAVPASSGQRVMPSSELRRI